ncbi:guanine deaminase [Novosphingobium sp. AAP93]|uniref:guanine deaminase n=1 Tax=Novosphingobium sp. AAP93 TaxID=1523427 RepID=UPI0006B9174B|nr:guanine deaminase [Novosphingobium sp. AAP93]KPF88475.1 guanine deaminase [Novosphingobium sp. AAP93]
MKGFRGEILSLSHDPAEGPDAVRHEADGLLVIDGGRIVARGAYSNMAPRFPGLAVERLEGLIVPGMIDAHVHYPQLGRIASHGEQLLDWLERHIFPAEKAFAHPVHAAAVAEEFLDELLRQGTTSALVFGTVHAASVEAFFAAAEARDLRMICGKVLMDLGPDGLRDSVREARTESAALIAKWHGRGRLGYAVTPRYALTSSDEQLAVAGELLAAHPGVLLHTHLAENKAEIAAVAARFAEAVDYLDAYDRFGLVTDRSVFAHGVHLPDRSCARLAETGAGIAVCPSSNFFLGSGMFDFGQAERHGVRLGLGSDIGAGTSLSLLHNGGLAYQAGLPHGYVLDPFRALWLATGGSARLLHIDGEVGMLAEGQEADFVVLDDAATPLMARRTAGASLAERLFALQVLGDDRAVQQTYVLGRCVWDRDAGHGHA